MVQELSSQGSVAGRIGKGFAQGLSEQVPKEIARSRLSSGLEDLAKKDFSGKDRLQILSEIAKIPGISENPQLMQTALQTIHNKNFINRKSSSDNGQGEVPKTGNQVLENDKLVGQSGLATPEQISSYKKNVLQEPSFEQINTLAKDYITQGLAQDPQEATTLAKTELTQNLLSQRAKETQVQTELNTRLELSAQGRGLGDFKEVPGQIQRDLIDQAKFMVRNGATPEEAAQKIEGIALEMSKTINNLKDSGSFWNMLGSSNKTITDVKRQREELAKYGYGELFDNMASAALGISPLETASFLDPLKNKKVKDSIESIKPFHFRVGATSTIKDESMKNIIRNIKPTDNIYAIEHMLRDKHVDLDQFKKLALELEHNKEIAFTKEQERQLKRPVNNNFLGDILFRAFRTKATK